MKEALFLVIYLVAPEGAPLVPQEIVAEMASPTACEEEVQRIKGLPYVADKMSGFYKLDAGCHDEDYIKRQQ
jgi:hypothetical protein